MTHARYDHDTLHLHFPGWEAIMVRRSSLAVPAAAILGVDVAPGWSSEILGIRSGLVVSGLRKLGTFRHPDGTRRLVSMKRGLPLLRVRVSRAQTGFDELLVSLPDAAAVAEALRPRVAP